MVSCDRTLYDLSVEPGQVCYSPDLKSTEVHGWLERLFQPISAQPMAHCSNSCNPFSS